MTSFSFACNARSSTRHVNMAIKGDEELVGLIAALGTVPMSEQIQWKDITALQSGQVSVPPAQPAAAGDGLVTVKTMLEVAQRLRAVVPTRTHDPAPDKDHGEARFCVFTIMREGAGKGPQPGEFFTLQNHILVSRPSSHILLCIFDLN